MPADHKDAQTPSPTPNLWRTDPLSLPPHTLPSPRRPTPYATMAPRRRCVLFSRLVSLPPAHSPASTAHARRRRTRDAREAASKVSRFSNVNSVLPPLKHAQDLKEKAKDR